MRLVIDKQDNKYYEELDSLGKANARFDVRRWQRYTEDEGGDAGPQATRDQGRKIVRRLLTPAN